MVGSYHRPSHLDPFTYRQLQQSYLLNSFKFRYKAALSSAPIISQLSMPSHYEGIGEPMDHAAVTRIERAAKDPEFLKRAAAAAKRNKEREQEEAARRNAASGGANSNDNKSGNKK
ncbi:hypothetical protein GE09DRAFT_1061890 [Coniochaeta sp. 2T2.1]|nr:hypothetical protein GE09DRAFT_1061890 [Coniochaeta sp. 2T2.1]